MLIHIYIFIHTYTHIYIHIYIYIHLTPTLDETATPMNQCTHTMSIKCGRMYCR